MPRIRSSYSLTGAFLLLCTVVATAAVPTFWRLENQADFLTGDTDGVSVTSDGTITLAPSAAVVAEATDPHFWSLTADESGNIYAGSGNDGKILKLDASGDSTVLVDTNELQVHALAVDGRGNVYAGTSPRGVVHRIDADGSQSEFFDPDDRYIWAIAVDSLGNVIVATGDKAQIHRVSPQGESEVLFTSEEMHIVSLAVDAQDRIFAGTDPNGLVLSVERSGATSVLFDTPLQEVRSLALDTRGNVYAAAVSGGTRSTPSSTSSTTTTTPGPQTTSPSTPGAENVTVTATATVVSSVGGSTTSGSSGPTQGALYRIQPDGSSEVLWRSSQDMPLSLALVRDDRLMIGTGKEGRIFLVSQDKTSTLLSSVEADQVTAILARPSGDTFLATSNPAKLYRLNRGRRTEGTYLSPTKDTTTVSSWGKIRWEARAPGGTAIKLQTRSGNSAEPDNTWSAWSQPYTSPEGEQITSPRGRFFQWRAILNSTGELTPELANVTAIYLQQNLSPQVSEITIHPPGQSYQKPIVATGKVEILGMDETVSVGQGTGNGRNGAQNTTAPAVNLTAMSRPIYRKGVQTVTWEASDPNEDDLVYEVHYRAQGESLWRVLREDVNEAVIAWDTVAMPDGRYSLKVVASDAPSNPADLARTGEKVSRSFEVDNTPPRVTGLVAEASGDAHRVRFVAEDAISPIRNVEYAVNSGRWHVVFPSDGIADSRQESFDFALEGYRDGGVYTLVVKVTDTLGNTGTARAELR